MAAFLLQEQIRLQESTARSEVKGAHRPRDLEIPPEAQGGGEDAQKGVKEAWGDVGGQECLYPMWLCLGARDIAHCHLSGLLVAATTFP